MYYVNILLLSKSSLKRTTSMLDECRIWTSVVSPQAEIPSRDTNRRSQKKRITRSGFSQDVRTTQFVYDNCVTFMPAIAASGEAGPCLFVFKGKTFPFRLVLKDGEERIDYLGDHLPSSAVLSMREEGGGVDNRNFLSWANHFVDHVKLLTRGGRKVLLMFDGYRSHMSVEVLTLFAQHNIIVYALSAHSSGKLQPLDVVAFATFKRILNDILYRSTDCFQYRGADVYDICDMIRKAYDETFTSVIIKSSFRRAGAWPVDASRLLNTPRPLDGDLSSTATVETMQQMMEERIEEFARSVFGEKIAVLDNGYVDTTNGAVLACAKAMDLIKKKGIAQIKAKRKEELERQKRLERAVMRQRSNRKHATKVRLEVDTRRAALAGMSLEEYRGLVGSMMQRRAIARVRTAEKRGYIKV